MGQRIRDVLLNISDLLKKSGVVNHHSEARAILANILDRELNRVHPAMNIEISDDDYSRLMLLVQRRIAGEPLQLITGCVGFHNCLLKCEKGVFIPRVETELLVDVTLKFLFDFPPDKSAKVLDLACGCGAIPIALALSEPRHHYHAVDASERAIELSKKNAELNSVSGKINFLRGDYFEPIREWKDIKFNVITANPPYVRTSDIPDLPKDVKDWDPRESLDGGRDGMSHYKIIGSELMKYLASDGIAIFEIDPDYVDPLKDIFSELDLLVSNIHKDNEGNDRAVEVRLKPE